MGSLESKCHEEDQEENRHRLKTQSQPCSICVSDTYMVYSINGREVPICTNCTKIMLTQFVDFVMIKGDLID